MQPTKSLHCTSFSVRFHENRRLCLHTAYLLETLIIVSCTNKVFELNKEIGSSSHETLARDFQRH